MYNLQKNCPQMSFPGRREAPNILHGGKMLAPHFKDEIASLHKWPFLACFWPFLEQFFFVMTHIYGQTKYILQKNCPHISFPCCREAPNILHPLLKRPHRLLNWQIQVTRVSWVGQSTRCQHKRRCLTLFVHGNDIKKVQLSINTYNGIIMVHKDDKGVLNLRILKSWWYRVPSDKTIPDK